MSTNRAKSVTEASTPKKKTNYVIVIDFEANVHLDDLNKDGMFLEDARLLGWNNRYDWFSEDIYGSDIITNSGRIKYSNDVGIIQTDRFNGAYVGETLEDCDYYYDMGKEEYDCTICTLIKTIEDD